MFRRTVLPLALFTLGYVAFAASCVMVADANDLGAIYFFALGVVSLRAQSSISLAGAT